MEAIGKESTMTTTVPPTILRELEIAMNDEILAAYQYWTAYQITAGPGKYDIDPILEEHTKQEWEHAEMLAKRIRELGGSPCLDISKLPAKTHTWVPVSPGSVSEIAKTIRDAEQRAVSNYKALERLTRDTDPVTHEIAVNILATESEHLYEMDILLSTV